MKLLTKDVENRIPQLGEGDSTAYVKFFTPWTYWIWYGCEYDPDTKLFFGYVEGHEKEWGYFSVEELEKVRGPAGMKVERDRFFTTQKVGG